MSTSEALTCRELVELITDYFENVMPLDIRSQFERHISDCHGCKGYLDQVRQTIRLTGQLSDDSLDSDVRERLLSAFRDWKSSNHATSARSD